MLISVAPGHASAPPADGNRRRQSTAPRFQALPQAAQTLAFGFRPLAKPRNHYSLLATFVVCALLQLLVGAPYAANECAADTGRARTALRGVIAGIWVCFVIGPVFLLIAPTTVCGGFRPRYLFSFPITLTVAVGVAFIGIEGSTLGILSVGAIAIILTFAACVLLLNARFFATDEHKALDESLGPPIFVIFVLFFGMITAYVTLTKLYSSLFVGLLLPIGLAATRVLAIYALVRSCHTFYYEPKGAFLTQLAASAHGQSNVVLPLLGDIEPMYGYLAAGYALIIGNAAFVASLVEVMLSPASTAWLLSLALASLLQVLTRTGLQQRVELWIAARLAARSGLEWLAHAAHTSTVEVVYLSSLGGTGHIAPTMAICVGCLRAVAFGDPRAIVWLDVSPTVWRVLVAQLAIGAMADGAVWAVARSGHRHFELSARFAADHPLRNTAFRDFDLKGYTVAFGIAGAAIYAVFVAFLGPAFVTGMCRVFAPNATHVWVQRALDCAQNEQNVSAVARVTNGSINGMSSA
jgi:hypothetical protein